MKKKKLTQKAAKKNMQKRKALPLKRIKKIIKKSIKRLSSSKLAKSFEHLADKVSLEKKQNQEPVAAGGFLPSGYGENKLLLMVRDPWWLFSYWEVTPEREGGVFSRVAAETQKPGITVLRVYDMTAANGDALGAFFDIEIDLRAGNWYVDVGKPGREWMAELGVRVDDGRFYPFVRSNRVKTPRYGVSDVIDEEWMLPDDLYWKIFGLSGGVYGSKSSLAVKEILERYLNSLRSSGGGSDDSPKKTGD